MPELPEVEIIRKGLEGSIVGKIIKGFEVNPPKTFSGKKSDLVGRKILSVKRRGKIIILSLSDAAKAIIHLKMTGQLIFDPSKQENIGLKKRIAGGHPSRDWTAELPNKYTHAIFFFDDKSTLYFNDLRKFGYIKYYKKGTIPEIEGMGVDALDKRFSADYLLEKSQGKSIEIKKFIMDQRIVAGIGNIYSDEALFCAGILPSRRVNKISLEGFRGLVECIKKVLREGMKHGGSSYRNFVDSSGKMGKMQDYFNVYGRAGKSCPGCGKKIVKTKIGGRSSCFCPVCQG
jgi:formamidopyrimidine-DNA glycosylase